MISARVYNAVISAIDAVFPSSQIGPQVAFGKHIPQLDAVRGLAILAVTLYRFRGDDVSSDFFTQLWLRTFAVGTRGVDLFFVLSGFLITGILDDCKGKQRYFTNFYARRTLRIFPLYYGVLFTMFVFFPMLGVAIANVFPEACERNGWLWSYMTNLRIAYEGQWCFGAFNHFWSLAVEEQFYLFWPLIIFYCSRKIAIRISFALIFTAAIARVAWVIQTRNYAAAEAVTLFRMDALVCGALLALAYRENSGLERFRRLAALALLTCLVLLLSAGVMRQKFATSVDTLFAVFFSSLLVLVLTVSPQSLSGRLWQSRLLTWLGKYSYGMYVFQNLLIPFVSPWIAIASFAEATGSSFGGRVAYMITMFAITSLVALLSWHFYEKHWLALKTHFE
jgi:peptidoglycan/LPS O-acetylase OafA/YrhL